MPPSSKRSLREVQKSPGRPRGKGRGSHGTPKRRVQSRESRRERCHQDSTSKTRSPSLSSQRLPSSIQMSEISQESGSDCHAIARRHVESVAKQLFNSSSESEELCAIESPRLSKSSVPFRSLSKQRFKREYQKSRKPAIQHIDRRLSVGDHYKKTHYFDVGERDIKCRHCGALHFKGQAIKDAKGGGYHFSSCCQNGKVKLDQSMEIKEPPSLLRQLVLGSDAESKNYQLKIRSYNCALTMASLKANIECSWSHVKIHGSVHHQIGAPELQDGQRARYSQLYFMEPEKALEERLGNPANDGCIKSVMEKLQKWLNRDNPIAKKYLAMFDRFQHDNSLTSMRLVFMNSECADPKSFDGTNSDEVAAVFC